MNTKDFTEAGDEVRITAREYVENDVKIDVEAVQAY